LSGSLARSRTTGHPEAGDEIGILGAGAVVQALGDGFIALGHDALFGSRDPRGENVQAWVGRHAGSASAGTFAEAAAFADLAVLATLWSGTENAIRLAAPDNLAGKVVIDVTNPLVFREHAPPALALGFDDSGGEQVQRWLPKAYVVKAFNTVGHAHIVNPQFPCGPPEVMAPAERVQHLIRAVRDGQTGAVQRLVDSDPALVGARDEAGVSAILLALYHGHPDIAQWLAARRRNLDVFEAAAVGEPQQLETLLLADPSLAAARSPDGFTALALAGFFGQISAVRTLLAHGADVNAVSHNAARYTALTGAVAAGQTAVVRELLQACADPNYRYGPGLTPLHVAAANGTVDIVQMLLEAGATPEAATDEGKTALDPAREKGHAAVVEMLASRH